MRIPRHQHCYSRTPGLTICLFNLNLQKRALKHHETNSYITFFLSVDFKFMMGDELQNFSRFTEHSLWLSEVIIHIADNLEKVLFFSPFFFKIPD